MATGTFRLSAEEPALKIRCGSNRTYILVSLPTAAHTDFCRRNGVPEPKPYITKRSDSISTLRRLARSDDLIVATTTGTVFRGASNEIVFRPEAAVR